MGAAASTEQSATVQQYRSSVLNGKPLDASDVKVRYRSFHLFKERPTLSHSFKSTSMMILISNTTVT